MTKSGDGGDAIPPIEAIGRVTFKRGHRFRFGRDAVPIFLVTFREIKDCCDPSYGIK